MKKPEKRDISFDTHDGTDHNRLLENEGYNQACEDWEKYNNFVCHVVTRSTIGTISNKTLMDGAIHIINMIRRRIT